MEIDIDELVIVAATISVAWQGNVMDKTCLIMAFEQLYPEANIVQRYRKQLKAYQKLTE